MAADNPLTKPVNVDDLLLSKRLEPLGVHHKADLEKIAGLDVGGFSEAEVRAYVIDPIVRILGYDKGSIFSADLEHSITFLGKNVRPDYQLTLWNENFWLIEAKRPQPNKLAFEYDDFNQAAMYSLHPSINASLVVLCDGLKLEIFDREATVDTPILHIAIKDIASAFDKVRAVLEPMQVWFFQKRRVVRLIDKVFDKEFNMNRLNEFSGLIERRLRAKHQTVLENFRATHTPDRDEDLAFVQTASALDLVEFFLFDEHRLPVVNAVNHRLVQLSAPFSFHVVHRIFPDGPRDVTDVYMGQALAYLMRLEQTQPSVSWLPSWLMKESTDPRATDSAIRFFLRQCLTYFADHEPYRVILLAANAIRRIGKVVAIGSNAVRSVGEQFHAIARHELPEMSWGQILASPEGQLIGLLDAQAREATYGFVKRHSTSQHSFEVESAKATLKSLWRLEAQILASIGNYAKLRRERSLGDMRSTEWCSVTYDYLGHIALCMMHTFPKWQNYTLQTHPDLMQQMVKLGSSKARKMLGIADHEKIDPPEDAVLAARFFFGDDQMLKTLRTHYNGQ